MASFAMAYGRTTTDPRQAHPCARAPSAAGQVRRACGSTFSTVQKNSTGGVRPWSWTGSRGGFDPLPGVVILELRGAQVAERGVQPASVVDLVNEAGKIRGDVLE